MQNISDNELVKILEERKKELTCIYETEEILLDFLLPLNLIVAKICGSIEKAMQYNEISRCQIIINEEVFCVNPFNKTELKLSSKVLQDSNFVEVDVFYIKPIRDEHHPIFLAEEQYMINNIASKLASYISHRKFKEQYEKGNIFAHPENTDKTNLIKWLKDFSLSDKEIDQICQKTIFFKKGETLCKQSTLANYLMLIADGYVKLTLEHFIDHHYIFKIVKPYEIIGLSAIFEASNYNFTATAITNSQVYLIENNLFKNLVLHNNIFAQKVLFAYSKNYNFILSRLNSVSNKQALGRLSDTLLYLSEEVFESNTIESFISRKDLAALTGISTENTVRLLSDLKANNIVSLNRNEIEITDKNKLIKLSQHG